MGGERRTRILSRLHGDGSDDLDSKRLCHVCADVTCMTGAGIMLMSGDLPQGTLCTIDKVSAIVEQLQYGLGEGPCVDAYHHDRRSSSPTWPRPAVPGGSPSPGPPSRLACGESSGSRSGSVPSASAP